MTPLTPAAVTALAQQAAESPAHLDPLLVQQVCREWEEQRERMSVALQRAEKAEKQRVLYCAYCNTGTRIADHPAKEDAVRAMVEHDVVCEQNPLVRRVNAAEAALAAARAALQAVEWLDTNTDPCGTLLMCPWCQSLWGHGHAPDCRLAAALGLTQGEGA